MVYQCDGMFLSCEELLILATTWLSLESTILNKKYRNENLYNKLLCLCKMVKIGKLVEPLPRSEGYGREWKVADSRHRDSCNENVLQLDSRVGCTFLYV